MEKVYANLIGNWVCLNDDPDCKIGDNFASPNEWWKEEPDIYFPLQREKKNSMYGLDYVKIHYKGVDYRINPIFIQVVTD